MLIMNVIYQHLTKDKEKLKNLNASTTSTLTKNERRKTKDVDRKRTEEGKKLNQNKCVSSQNNRTRKEEGATVAATYLLSGETVRAGLIRAGRAAILHGDIQLYRKPP